MSEGFRYQGAELDLFANAQNWKRYWAAQIRPWLTGDVLEVGAGIGTNAVLLQNSAVKSWHCIEPDPELRLRLAEAVSILPNCQATGGTIESVAVGKLFDSILYIDVLEHIESDREELARSVRLLRPGGHLIVLSPAHQSLFSAFDVAVGHFRRYDRKSLLACSPAGVRLEALFYLDSVGVCASLANRVMLRQGSPMKGQILTWDKFFVPVSRILDRVGL